MQNAIGSVLIMIFCTPAIVRTESYMSVRVTVIISYFFFVAFAVGLNVWSLIVRRKWGKKSVA